MAFPHGTRACTCCPGPTTPTLAGLAPAVTSQPHLSAFTVISGSLHAQASSSPQPDCPGSTLSTPFPAVSPQPCGHFVKRQKIFYGADSYPTPAPQQPASGGRSNHAFPSALALSPRDLLQSCVEVPLTLSPRDSWRLRPRPLLRLPGLPGALELQLEWCACSPEHSLPLRGTVTSGSSLGCGDAGCPLPSHVYRPRCTPPGLNSNPRLRLISLSISTPNTGRPPGAPTAAVCPSHLPYLGQQQQTHM